MRNLPSRVVTKNDIEYMLDRAEKERTMDSKQINLLNSILEFPTIKVMDIMIPRQKVQYIKSDCPFNEVIRLIRLKSHSRYPVCNGDLDHTIGFLHVKDLASVRRGEQFDIKKHLNHPIFVYEHMKIQAVFDHMNRKKVHLALVKDENGLVVGIVTLEDIMEEIFGEIQDEHDDEIIAQDKVGESSQVGGGLVLSGALSLRDLANDYGIKIPSKDNYSTLRGFLLYKLGNRFPKQGQLIVWDDYTFCLEKVDNYEIERVSVTHSSGKDPISLKIADHKQMA